MNAIIRRGCCAAAVCLVVTASASRAHGQNITIQQPVIGQFQVNTAVSVPDRGSALLGGVSSSQVLGDARQHGPRARVGP